MEEVVSLDCVMQPRHMSAYWHFSEVRQHPIHVRNLRSLAKFAGRVSVIPAVAAATTAGG
jgi:hypothetical protein